MKSAREIVDVLNEVLATQLVAINQYFVHAKLCEHWGYLRLAFHVRSESLGEMKHAEALVDRILFLEGIPNLQRLDSLHIGQSVPEQMKSDVELEYRAVKRLNDAVRVCRDVGDRATEDLLAGILVSEEEHVDWLETQLGLIGQIGEASYLAEHLHAS